MATLSFIKKLCKNVVKTVPSRIHSEDADNQTNTSIKCPSQNFKLTITFQKRTLGGKVEIHST